MSNKPNQKTLATKTKLPTKTNRPVSTPQLAAKNKLITSKTALYSKSKMSDDQFKKELKTLTAYPKIEALSKRLCGTISKHNNKPGKIFGIGYKFKTAKGINEKFYYPSVIEFNAQNPRMSEVRLFDLKTPEKKAAYHPDAEFVNITGFLELFIRFESIKPTPKNGQKTKWTQELADEQVVFDTREWDDELSADVNWKAKAITLKDVMEDKERIDAEAEKKKIEEENKAEEEAVIKKKTEEEAANKKKLAVASKKESSVASKKEEEKPKNQEAPASNKRKIMEDDFEMREYVANKKLKQEEDLKLSNDLSELKKWKESYTQNDYKKMEEMFEFQKEMRDHPTIFSNPSARMIDLARMCKTFPHIRDEEELKTADENDINRNKNIFKFKFRESVTFLAENMKYVQCQDLDQTMEEKFIEEPILDLPDGMKNSMPQLNVAPQDSRPKTPVEVQPKNVTLLPPSILGNQPNKTIVEKNQSSNATVEDDDEEENNNSTEQVTHENQGEFEDSQRDD